MTDAPFWSVMIPTYRPDPVYLRQTLESVLSQRVGEEMEIVVVDDASPDVDVAAMVAGFGFTTVRVERNPNNRGLAGNWNTCIARARGTWVHLLHQDDLVYDGFYKEMGELARRWPELSAMFCRHEVIDHEGRSKWTSGIERESPGPLEGFVEPCFLGVRMLCPAVVVSRETYRRVGEYRTDLKFALDWDMWKRIAAVGTWGFHPRVLAAYRNHPCNETSRLTLADECFPDILKSVQISRAYLPGERGKWLSERAKRNAYRIELGCAWADLARGMRASARRRVWNLMKRGFFCMEMGKLLLCTWRQQIRGGSQNVS